MLSTACGSLSGLGVGPANTTCDWSLSRLAAQVVVVPADESYISSVAPAVAAGAGGVILFGNLAPPDLRDQLSNLVRQAPGSAPFVMADEEGGVVQRLGNSVGYLPSARWMADHWSSAVIEQHAAAVGARMKALGVTMDLAPVLDLDAYAGAPNTVDADGNRSFGDSVSLATQDGLAFAHGMVSSGVVPVVKHFPGLGSTVGNTDLGPAHTLSWDVLQQQGLRPFVAAAQRGLPVVMVANASVPRLTNLPASLSHRVMTDVLRGRLHFTGMIMTDTLSAGAITAYGYSATTAAVVALKAGASMILYGGPGTSPAEFNQVTSAIVNAVNHGTLSREALVRAVNYVLAAKHVTSCGS